MRPARTLMALSVAAALLPAAAQAADNEELLKEMRRLAARVEALEAQNKALERALGSEYRRESDPEVAQRIKTVEAQTAELREKKHILDALDGIQVGGSLVTVAHSAPRRATTTERNANELNWRGDLTVEMPAGEAGDTSGKLFAHVRVGQGDGLGPLLRPTYTGNVNSTAFGLGGSADRSDSTALLAQLWYQFDIGLPNANQDADRRVEVTVGKMDPFVFFDQNGAADDESAKFLNNVFVHNAQLDSGGDVGADSYGFSPGVRVAYRDESEGSQYWQASAAMFGSGNGATYSTSFSRPFVIGQLERGLKLFSGLDGTYRLYAWRNGRAGDYDGVEAPHSGWGVSIDQRVPGGVTVFGRYGHQMSGRVLFDRSLSMGAELSGNAWNRGADSLGLAFGMLRTSKAWQSDALAVSGAEASGRERIVELYYRWQLNDAFALTPDVQYIVKPAAAPNAKGIFVYGLRAKASF